MKSMKRMLLISSTCSFVASNYGIAHNLISYQISPNYFSAYQFGRFQIPVEYWDLRGAAIVGVFGTWWVGLIMGLLISGFSQKLIEEKQRLFHTCISAACIAIVTVGSGIYGYTSALYESQNPVNIAESLHNHGYFGAAAGTFIGLLYLVVMHVYPGKDRKTTSHRKPRFGPSTT